MFFLFSLLRNPHVWSPIKIRSVTLPPKIKGTLNLSERVDDVPSSLLPENSLYHLDGISYFLCRLQFMVFQDFNRVRRPTINEKNRQGSFNLVHTSCPRQSKQYFFLKQKTQGNVCCLVPVPLATVRTTCSFFLHFYFPLLIHPPYFFQTLFLRSSDGTWASTLVV